jgi:hypothetical protein
MGLPIGTSAHSWRRTVVGWKLLQRMVKMLRATREEAHELENALGTLRRFDERYPG